MTAAAEIGDMAALRHRLEEEKADWLISVTDAGQATHFQQVCIVNITMHSEAPYGHN